MNKTRSERVRNEEEREEERKRQEGREEERKRKGGREREDTEEQKTGLAILGLSLSSTLGVKFVSLSLSLSLSH